MSTTLLIDGDIFIYKAAVGAQTAVDFGDGQWGMGADLPAAKAHLDEIFKQIQTTLKADIIVIALSDRQNSYKANRKDTQRPLLLEPLRQHVRDSYSFFERPLLEADDVLGILATNPKIIKGTRIIVSSDKDMRTIPCLLYNPDWHEEPEEITKFQADYSFHVQILTGDRVDGYGGCPNVGKKKAAKLLADTDPAQWWGIIVGQYEKAGLGEADALQTAQVARILRHEDYNYKEKRPCLWTPKTNRTV